MPSLTLNDRRIASLKATRSQRDYFDAALPGFGIRVSSTGRKTWMLLHRINGRLRRQALREPETGVSTYPKLPLARARELAREALRGSTVGRDVAAERKQTQQRTVSALADLYLEQHAKRKKRSWREDARMIRKDLAGWRDRPVASIRRADVRDLLETIVARGAPVLANRVLSLVTKMFNVAVDREWLDANPAARMAKPAAEHSRTRVLTADEIRTLWLWLEQPAPTDDPNVDPEHWRLTQAALKLRLVTAQRGKEVLSMRAADLDGEWWTIPAEVAKNKLAHRVPITPLARGILDTLPETFFVGIRGARHRRGVLDNLPIADFMPKDLRRTAASGMASAGISRFVIARVLNHVEKGITAVYDRHSYDAEKRIALETWARVLNGILERTDDGNVLAFTKGTSR